MPPMQVHELYKKEDFLKYSLSPCVAVLLEFNKIIETEYDAIFFESSNISFASRDSSKPGRPDGERWVIHAERDWSEKYYSKSSKWLIEKLKDEFLAALCSQTIITTFEKCHRWRYSKAENPASLGSIFDPDKNIGFCGDWLSSNRIEGAFLSGLNLADRIIKSREKLSVHGEENSYVY